MKTNTKTSTTSTKSFHDGMTYKLWMTCACGCGEVVRNNYKQGHDMRVQPHLVKIA